MLFRLAYFSGESRRLTNEELESLAERAQSKNSDIDVTGLLLYRHGNFLQVLEGEKGTVKSLFEKIKTDPRHRRVMILLEEPILSRDFTMWSMGFRNLDNAMQVPSELNPLLLLELDGTEGPRSESVSKLIQIFSNATSAGDSIT